MLNDIGLLDGEIDAGEASGTCYQRWPDQAVCTAGPLRAVPGVGHPVKLAMSRVQSHNELNCNLRGKLGRIHHRQWYRVCGQR